FTCSALVTGLTQVRKIRIDIVYSSFILETMQSSISLIISLVDDCPKADCWFL
ncbi:MAG: hypothetical protein ACI9UH_001065, partial [Gammaproteobacteria bacterium]